MLKRMCVPSPQPRLFGTVGRAQVRDEETALKFLNLYDEQIREGKTVHRVAEYFAGAEAWSLRRDLEQLAHEGTWTSRLAEEVSAYGLCLTDETCVEAIHRDVSKEGKRVTRRTFPEMGASLRMKQNLSELDEKGPLYTDLVTMHFSKLSVIARKDPSAQDRAQGVRGLSLNSLTQFVYLCGPDKFVEFGVFNEQMASFFQGLGLKQQKCNSLLDRCRLDHLRALTDKWTLYSVPVVRNEVLQKLGQTNHTYEQAVTMIRDGTVGMEIFQVIQTDLQQKKIAKGTLKEQLKGMTMPVQLQRYATVGEDRALLRPEGEPEVVDFFSITSWPILRCSLTKWTMQEADDVGLLRVNDPELIKGYAPLESRRISALSCIEQLLSRGWVFDKMDVPSVHTLETPKRFHGQDPLRSKWYFQCLVHLDHLMQRPDFEGLKAKAAVAYYKSCLFGTKKQDHGKPNSDKEDDVASLDGEEHSDSSESENSVVNHEERPRKTQRRMNPAEPGAVDLLDVVKDALFFHLEEAAVEDPVQSLSAPGPVVQIGGSSSSTSTSNQTPAPTQALDPLPGFGGDDDGDGQFGPPQMILPLSLEGISVRLEKQRLIQHYDRIMVYCNRRHEHTKKCEKKRNTGADQTNNFGPIEPYAYLGVWLERSGEYTSKADHMLWKPDVADVEDYIKRKFPQHRTIERICPRR